MNKTDDSAEILLLSQTHEFSIIHEMRNIYDDIEQKQETWKASIKLSCPDSCGMCCEHFEPELFESEALFLGAWMIINQRNIAQQIAEGSFVSPNKNQPDGCILFNPNSPYHCTVYGGRALICRLFGYSGDYNKKGELRWKPCRFVKDEWLKSFNLKHKQYSLQEMQDLFGALPPAMTDLTQRAVLLTPNDNATTPKPLRESLVAAIQKLLLLMKFNNNDNDNNDDNNTPLSA